MRRMGDLRLNQNESSGVWVRQYGGEATAKSAYGREVRQKYHGFHLGFDKQFSLQKGTNYTGFFGHNLEGSQLYERGSINTELARLGILLGKNTSGRAQGNYYLKASVLRDFGSSGNLSASYLNASQQFAAGPNMGTALELNLGANLQLNKKSSMYFESAKSFGGNLLYIF